jgi:hypothetical protein
MMACCTRRSLAARIAAILTVFRSNAMPAKPLQLSLKAEGLKLVASVHNLSSTPQFVLFSDVLQPLDLTLLDSSGRPIRPHDSRPAAKVDATIYRELFHEIQPGDTFVIRETEFLPEGHGFWLVWGPRQFRGLLPGAYKAKIEWHSTLDEYMVPPSYKRVRLKGVWKGSLVSDVVEIELRQ